jgi:hypothetical protein
MNGKTMAVVCALALCAACSGGDEFAAATPDAAGQMVEITGASTETPTALVSSLQGQQDLLSNPPEWLADTRAALKGLNTLVAKFLDPVAQAIAAGGTSADANTKVYGPKDENGITWKLTVARVASARFAWKLEGKPVGAADTAYRIVAAGALARIVAAEHRGSGVIGIDLDAYATLDATSHATGKVFNAFKHVGADGNARVLVYVLKNFSADTTTQPQPADAIIYGHRTTSGEAVVRVVSYSESLPPLSGGTDAGAELMLARLHFIPTVGGRADVYFPATGIAGGTNGDVPSGKYIVGASCWNAAEQEQFKAVLLCAQGQPVGASSCTSTVDGSPSACQPGVDTANTPTDSDASSTTEEPGAPATLDDTPPTSMPGF